METKDFLIIGLSIIIFILIIGFLFYAFVGVNLHKKNVENNITILKNNSTDDIVVEEKNPSSKQKTKYSSEPVNTGKYDKYGSPIYYSSSYSEGGQESPGWHSQVWSENGPV